MKRTRMFSTVAAICMVGAVVSAYGLEGKSGHSATLLLTPSGVHTDVGYSGATHAVDWQELATLEFWAPIGGGQRDGIAANASGDLFLLVRGFDSNSTGPQYTGLVRYDGTTLTSLVQDVMSSPLFASRTGSELRGVVTSPTGSGALTAGDPVVLRQVNTSTGGTLSATFEVVSVSRATGAETLVHAFGVEAAQAKVAIDGSGGALDGNVYVGPMGDGDIACLASDGGGYTRTDVPIAFDADHGLTIDAQGDLYTFDAAGTDWGGLASPYPDHEIVRVDPTTGSASTYGYVEGKSFIFDWVWGDAGALWMGLRQSGGKRRHYVSEAPAGGVTSVGARITESGADPWSLAAGADGVLYVLEAPFSSDGAVFRLDPSSGGGGNGNGGGKGKKK